MGNASNVTPSIRIRIATWVVVLCIALGSTSSSHADTLLGSYALGETGTVGSAPTYVSLIDSVGPANNIDGSQNIQSGAGTAQLVTSGLAAPGSTAALELSTQPAARNSGWFAGNNGYGLIDNWNFELWFRPSETTTSSNSYIFAATDNSASAVSLELNNNTINLLAGIDENTRIVGASYTVGTWYSLNVRDENNLVSLSINGTPVITNQPLGGSRLDLLRLGFGPNAPSGRGANGTFDEMRVSSVPVPEPHAYVLQAAGGLIGLLGYRRWRNRG